MDVDLDRDCWDIVTRCACEALRRTTRAVTAHYQERLGDTGVRAAQLPILVGAHLTGPVAVGALADRLLMDRTTLTRNLKGLEQEGLVAMEADNDRRVRLIVVTEAGKAALAAAVPAWREAQREVETALGELRVRSLVAELGSLTAAVKGEMS